MTHLDNRKIHQNIGADPKKFGKPKLNLPSDDTELLDEILKILYRFDPNHNIWSPTVFFTDAKDLIKLMERLGYRKDI